MPNDRGSLRQPVVMSIFDVLEQLHRYVNEKCILDVELVAINNGVPDFYELQRRTLLSNSPIF
ncbi:hypothetical protein [Metaclostridioides mangenotii]|uniref:hypothetical protein n=1 Tax=Metaclostridioides mangenotii TaxID=1540 RepID=UPI0028EBD1EC|nr:hypothetical protein [Clostridioides mangenotii]